MGASVSTASFTVFFFVDAALGVLSARSGSGVVDRAWVGEVAEEVEEGGNNASLAAGVVSPMRSLTSRLISSRSRVRGSAFCGDVPACLQGRRKEGGRVNTQYAITVPEC